MKTTAPKSVRDLCVTRQRGGYYADSGGLVGVQELAGDLIEWFRYDYQAGVYTQTGSTLTPEGADYYPLITKARGHA